MNLPPPSPDDYIMLISMQLSLTVTDCEGEQAELSSPALSRNNMTPEQWLQWLDAEFARLRAKAQFHLQSMAQRSADYRKIGIRDNEYAKVANALGTLGTIPGAVERV